MTLTGFSASEWPSPSRKDCLAFFHLSVRFLFPPCFSCLYLFIVSFDVISTRNKDNKQKRGHSQDISSKKVKFKRLFKAFCSVYKNSFYVKKNSFVLYYIVLKSAEKLFMKQVVKLHLATLHVYIKPT